MVSNLAWLVEAGRVLRAAFVMFWQTLWPLVLGFGLSGAVQSFVSREAMRRALGSRRPSALARASGYGMASSSCSYAASAMAKSLFAKGADFVTALVFMVASTNLVIELGIVVVVLLGWQFAVGEYIGGAIMIVLLAATGGLWLRGREVSRARERLASTDMASGHTATGAGGSLARRLRSPAGWADAASYTIADLRMVRRELLAGYVIAGLLAVLVPAGAWHAVFWTGHGLATSVENVLVGPLIAVVSFVCSIGNVPLAAALWHGGISFGGVISFLFADLITFPLLLIYRRYYGWRLMVRMFATLWAVMAAAGLLTETLLGVSGAGTPSRAVSLAAPRFGWDLTTILNLIFLVLLAALYWLHTQRGRLGGGREHARDPVCGMRVEIAHALASVTHGGHTSYFCSDHCAHRFTASPGAFAAGATPGAP